MTAARAWTCLSWLAIGTVVFGVVWGPRLGRVGEALAVVAGAIGGLSAVAFLAVWAVSVWPRREPPLWTASEDCLARHAGPRWLRRRARG